MCQRLGDGERRGGRCKAGFGQSRVERARRRTPDAVRFEKRTPVAKNLARLALGNDRALAAEHDHAVDGLDQPIETVIDDKNAAVSVAYREQRVQTSRRFGREMCRGLVGDEERRVLDQRRRERDELPFAARELRRAAPAPRIGNADTPHDI